MCIALFHSLSPARIRVSEAKCSARLPGCCRLRHAHQHARRATLSHCYATISPPSGRGGVAERSKAAVLKTASRFRRDGGSNPSSSAMHHAVHGCASPPRIRERGADYKHPLRYLPLRTPPAEPWRRFPLPGARMSVRALRPKESAEVVRDETWEKTCRVTPPTRYQSLAVRLSLMVRLPLTIRSPPGRVEGPSRAKVEGPS